MEFLINISIIIHICDIFRLSNNGEKKAILSVASVYFIFIFGCCSKRKGKGRKQNFYLHL